ncbi:cholecystokinin receptor-like [Diadema setosum]|uniref:cholecystokinin receptor-like n=1 Tax=Diadema setosum TaxID=31175 RepID=UPI003B3A2A22
MSMSTSTVTFNASVTLLPSETELTACTGFGVVQVFQVLIGFLGLFGNSTCVIVLRRQSVSNNTNWLIVNQAVIDSITSFILIATVISEGCGIRYIPKPPLVTEIYCKLWNSFLFVFSGFAVSTFNLVVLSIERYLAVVHPVWYLHHFKKRAVYILGVSTWFLGPIFQFLLVFLHYDITPEGQCRYTPKYQGILVMLFVWEYFIPVCIMTFSFVSILRKFRELNKVAHRRGAGEFGRMAVLSIPSSSALQTRAQPTIASAISEEPDKQADGGPVATISCPGCDNATNLQGSSSNDIPEQKDPTEGKKTQQSGAEQSMPSAAEQPRRSNATGMIQRRNTTKVLLAMYLLYLICWSPNQWTFLQFNLGGYIDFDSGWYRFLVIMGTLNTCVNPFLFAFRLKVYRNEMAAMFRGCCRHH